MMLSAEKLKTALSYNRETGIFVWKYWRGGTAVANSIAGTVSSNGYIRINLFRKNRLAHRLAWLYEYGYFPENDIDHINRDRADNRISNLREATRSCNMRNAKNLKNNTSGVKGVRWREDLQRWHVSIGVKGQGSYVCIKKDFDEAVLHRLAAEQCLSWSTCGNESTALKYIKTKEWYNASE